MEREGVSSLIFPFLSLSLSLYPVDEVERDAAAFNGRTQISSVSHPGEDERREEEREREREGTQSSNSPDGEEQRIATTKAQVCILSDTIPLFASRILATAREMREVKRIESDSLSPPNWRE